MDGPMCYDHISLGMLHNTAEAVGIPGVVVKPMCAARRQSGAFLRCGFIR